MNPQQIAAEVSARYGVTVQPEAVKIIPQGHMATAVNYRWDGFQLKNMESADPLRDAKNAMWKNAQRSKRLANAKAPKEPKVHPQIIRSQERQAETAGLAAKGYTMADLAHHFNVTEGAMRKYCSKFKITVTARLSGRAARREERRAKVMEFAGSGDKTIRQIADYFGCTWSAAQAYCTARQIPYRVKRGNADPLTGPGALEPLPANGGM